MNFLTAFAPSSSIETPKISKPLSFRRSRSLTRSGSSSLHGSHQVAQKSTSTTLPAKAESVRVLPSSVGPERGGAFSFGSGEFASEEDGGARRRPARR